MHTVRKAIVLTSLIVLSLGLCLDTFAANNSSFSIARDGTPHVNEGIGFSCDSNRLSRIKSGMAAYLTSLGIAPKLVVARVDSLNGVLVFTLNTHQDDANTLSLKGRPEYAIKDSVVYLPSHQGKMRRVVTVSKKEILLALLQRGRFTEFSGENCHLNALKEQVNVRQNIVAWAERLNWVWPDGEAAEWNDKYWSRGTPLPNIPLRVAFGDVFKHHEKYAIGCYTAAKLVMVQGVLDYYHRIKKDKVLQKRLEERLLRDQEPLVDVEPGEMWSFEKDFDSQKRLRLGKILKIQYGIAPQNFVPGDWSYVLNTDPISSQKIGYEGSNAIYLGRNKFVDFYNDNQHAYSYQQKLDEVYQWRNGVFSRSRDAEKIQPLSKNDFERLGKSPASGGLVQEFRVFPLIF